MKFNFDNLNKEEPVPEVPQTPEMTQEEFDMQIEKEANKLKTSVEELAKEINEYGGPEEFKKKMEAGGSKSVFSSDGGTPVKGSAFNYSPGGRHGMGVGPIGNEIIKDLGSAAQSHEHTAKEGFKWAGVMAGITAVIDILAELSDEIGMVSPKELIEKLQSSSGASGIDYGYTGLVAFFAVAGSVGLVSGIREKIKANRTRREVARQELKHKMTGVEFNQG